jgi:hypothetical protein
MNKKLSNTIEYLFTIRAWDWHNEKIQDNWDEQFTQIIHNYTTDDFFFSLNIFLELQEDKSIILNHFIKRIRRSLDLLAFSKAIKLSGKLHELNNRMLSEKRPFHKSYNNVFIYKLSLDKRIFYNHLIQCFLQSSSLKNNYIIWKERIHLFYNPAFAFKRNTPGNDYIFPVEVFSLEDLIKDFPTHLYFIKLEPNHQEILFYLANEQIKLVTLSQNYFKIFFQILVEISNEHKVLTLLKMHVYHIAKTALKKNILKDEELALGDYFNFLNDRYNRYYDTLIGLFNVQIENDKIIFNMWAKFKHFNPSIDFLNNHIEMMQFKDYLSAPKDFHLCLLQNQLVRYKNYNKSDYIVFGLITMCITESPSKTVQAFQSASPIQKIVWFYSFNNSFPTTGNCFETIYNYDDYLFTNDEILTLNSSKLDLNYFFKLCHFVYLIQYEYSRRTEKFGYNKPIGFFKMDDGDRIKLVESCWNKLDSVKKYNDGYINNIILTIKSESTFALGKIMIKFLLENNIILIEDILNQINLNLDYNYQNKLNQFIKENY